MRARPPAMVAIAHKLRDLMAEVYAEVVEIPRPAEQHVGYAVGAHKSTETFGYICPMQDYVRLGFYYGAALPDPTGILVGTGKRLRHIKLYAPADAERAEVRQLLAAAVEERRAHGMQ